MRESRDFAATIHKGIKVRTPTLTVYIRVLPTDEAGLCKVGFVVSKRIGNSVIRHRVVRQLRHIAREVLPLDQGCTVVVRAHPKAAHVPFSELYKDMSAACTEANFAQAKKKMLEHSGCTCEKKK